MSRRTGFTTYFGLMALTLIFSLSVSADVTKTLEAKMKASRVSADDIGAIVAQLKNGRLHTVFEHQSKKDFVPASVTKIIPAGAALKILGPTRTFKTEILATAPLKGTKLKGDIYLKGGGDPAFVTEKLWVLVNSFHRTGIEVVEGDIVVDDSLFDDVRFDPSRENSRVDRAYDAPISAMSFNWNSVNVYVRPGNKVGDKASVHADPENDLVQVDNKVKTVGANQRTRISVRRVSLGQGKEKIVVQGQIPYGQPEKVYYKNVTHPSLWSAANLKSALEIRGVQVKGKIKRGTTPEGALVLAEVESKPLSQIVQDMMKFSNNYVAEMLTKHLALAQGAPQGNMDAGMEALRTYVSSTGVLKDHFQLVNPSGLTRDNRFRPVDFLKILEAIQRDFLISPETMASFPLSGLDGTLKSRLKNLPGRVRAKTGMLSGVIGLAGWMEGSEGPLLFVFLYNGKDHLTESAKDLFDQMLETLIQTH